LIYVFHLGYFVRNLVFNSLELLLNFLIFIKDLVFVIILLFPILTFFLLKLDYVVEYSFVGRDVYFRVYHLVVVDGRFVLFVHSRDRLWDT
tara:strand:- start:130 stop:402 length:273 start_codon:yes stop_codon:yes gene_type:complete